LGSGLLRLGPVFLALLSLRSIFAYLRIAIKNKQWIKSKK
jgi:hypothetical protein